MRKKNLFLEIIMLIVVTAILAVFIVYYVRGYKAAISGEGADIMFGEDNRVPNYTETKVDLQPVNYSFVSYNGMMTFNTTKYYDKNVYLYYRTLDRYYEGKNYGNYVLDEHNLEAVSQVVGILRECKIQAGYSDYEMVMEAINFVQKNIEYKSDMETMGVMEYPRYPIETLFDGCGDCEDTSVLLAAIIKEMDYGVILLAYDDHMAVGIKGGDGLFGTYYEYEGEKYFYVETTAYGWTIGDVPAEYMNKQAEVIVIN